MLHARNSVLRAGGRAGGRAVYRKRGRFLQAGNNATVLERPGVPARTLPLAAEVQLLDGDVVILPKDHRLTIALVPVERSGRAGPCGSEQGGGNAGRRERAWAGPGLVSVHGGLTPCRFPRTPLLQASQNRPKRPLTWCVARSAWPQPLLRPDPHPLNLDTVAFSLPVFCADGSRDG